MGPNLQKNQTCCQDLLKLGPNCEDQAIMDPIWFNNWTTISYNLKYKRTNWSKYDHTCQQYVAFEPNVKKHNKCSLSEKECLHILGFRPMGGEAAAEGPIGG